MKMMKMILLVGIESGKSSPIKLNFSFGFLPISLSSDSCQIYREMAEEVY